MSATISYLPGASGVPDQVRGRFAGGAGSAADKERVARLIEFYQRIGSASSRSFDSEAVSCALRALNEGRERDALDLIEIAFEEPECDPADANLDGEGIDDTPIPEIARTWRYSPRTAISCVGGTDEAAFRRHPALVLEPKRVMKLDDAPAWSVGVGDFEFDRRSCRASIELGSKGEIVLLLTSGRMTVDMGGDLGETEIGCSDGAPELVRVSYVRGRFRAAKGRPFQLDLVADPLAIPQGVWFVSSVDQSESEIAGGKGPDEDLVFVSRFAPITPPMADGFCEGASPVASSDNYRHMSAANRGDFARFELSREHTGTCGDWSLEEASVPSVVTGYMAVPLGRFELGDIDRELTVHEGHVELIVALNGVTWVAVSPQRRSVASDDPGKHVLSAERRAAGEHEPVFLTPLVGTIDGGFDVMMLRPSFGHAVWLTPGSQSRFIHVAFDNPVQMTAKRQKSKVGARRVGPDLASSAC